MNIEEFNLVRSSISSLSPSAMRTLLTGIYLENFKEALDTINSDNFEMSKTDHVLFRRNFRRKGFTTNDDRLLTPLEFRQMLLNKSKLNN